MAVFEIDNFVNNARQAANAQNPRAAIKSLMEATVGDPVTLQQSIPDYDEDDIIWFEDEHVSIWHCRFIPGKSVPPHDHQMSATIGLYRGSERNEFYNKPTDTGIIKSGELILQAGDVTQIGPNAIHSVRCVGDQPCCGIHVYLGKLTTVQRSLVDPRSGEQLAFSDDNYQ